jgi:hypothetical protein
VPPFASPEQLSAHLFRLAVLQDQPTARGAGVVNGDGDGDGDGADGAEHEHAHGEWVDTRGAAERVNEGRRWLHGLLTLWALIENGAPPGEGGGAAVEEAEGE